MLMSSDPELSRGGYDMNIRELWKQLLQRDEHIRLEVKLGNEIGNSVMQTVCAYANTIGLDGGYLLLGIKEDKSANPKYTIVGVDNPDKLQSDLATQCSSKFNEILRPKIQSGVLEGKTVICVYTPEAEARVKPIFVKKQGLDKGTYIRVGPTDQVCTPDDLAQLFQLRNIRPYDETLLPQTSLLDINPNALDEYRRLRAKKNPNAPELRYTDEELLGALHCIESTDGISKPTIAGLLLFGTEKVLRRYFSMMRFDYVRVKGRDWGGETDGIYYSIELREALLTLLPKAEAAIMDDMEREFSFPKGSLTREEKPAIPYDAIREVLVNAVMHRDYQVAGPTLAIRFTDRIEFHNPGYSLKPIERIGTPGSQSRNQTIASVLHETEYAENKGSGIAKVQRKMQEAQLPPPHFESSKADNTFVATLSLHQLMDEAALAWLNQFNQFNLSGEEARTLVFARNNGCVSNEECRKLTGYDTPKASNLLKRLRGLGILEQHSHGPGTYYTLSEICLQEKTESDLDVQREVRDIQIETENKPDSDLVTQLKVQDTQIETENKPDSDLVTQLKVQDTQIELRREHILSSLPDVLRDEIQSLGQRISPEKREEMIVRVCEVHPFTATEISILFRKTRTWAKNRLRELVNAKRISLTIPDKPNSRNQAYYVPESSTQMHQDGNNF